MPGYSAGIGLPYAPQQARQLLAEAGYPDGRGFPAIEAHHSRTSSSVEYLQAQWQENLGIDIAWKPLRGLPLISAPEEERPHIFLAGWVADYPDPDSFLGQAPPSFLLHGITTITPHW